MALAEREILLIIRARNMADRALRDVSNQLRGLDGDLNHVGDSFEKAGSDAPNRFKKGFDRNRAGMLGSAADMGRRFVTTLGLVMQGAVFRNPQIAFALGGALLIVGIPLLAMAGAALASAFVLAFGGGLSGMFLHFAAQSDRVIKGMQDLTNYMGDNLIRISKPFEDTWMIILDGARDLFSYLLPTLEDAADKLAPVVSAFADDLFEALRELEPVLPAMVDAFTEMMGALGPALPGIMQGFADALILVADTIKENPEVFANLVGDFFDLINAILQLTAWLTQLYAALIKFEDDQGNFMADLGAAWGKDVEDFVTRAKEDWNEFKTAVGDAWNSAIQWAARAAGDTLAWLGNIAAGVAQMPGQISKSAKNWWTGVKGEAVIMRDNVKQRINDINVWAKGNAARLSSAVAGWWTSARQRADDMRFFVVGKINAVVAWVKSRPAAISSAVSGWWTGALRKAEEFRSGVVNKVQAIVNWLRGLPGKITSAVGNLGNVLWNAGRSIIQGLIDGVQSKFNSLRNKLRELTDMLPDWKGPMTRDLKLLAPSGEAIMRGLRDGLWAGLPEVESTLKSISDRISTGGSGISLAAGSGGSGAGFRAPGGDAGGGVFGPNGVRARGGSGNVYVDVHTQEINPVKNAADLGWEIVRELGDFSW